MTFHTYGIFFQSEVQLVLSRLECMALRHVSDERCLQGVCFPVGEAQAVVPFGIGGHSDGSVLFHEHRCSGKRPVVRIEHFPRNVALCGGTCRDEEAARQHDKIFQYRLLHILLFFIKWAGGYSG